VTHPDKAFFVQGYFEQVILRIERLAKLRSKGVGEVSFKDEAFILCLVYIDSLASCYYGETNFLQGIAGVKRESTIRHTPPASIARP
jgi:hypothetical protein